MHRSYIYCAGSTPAIEHAKTALKRAGFPIISEPSWNTRHLLLDIPSFREHTILRTGGNADTLLSSLPKDIVIWGGNFPEEITTQYHTVDLLKDELYLARNAAITADCALQIASPLLRTTWQDSSVLIIGWGRIGKCLSQLLKALGCDVTVTSRDPKNRAALISMGFKAVDPQSLCTSDSRYHIIFNTAPNPVICTEDTDRWKDCIKIDLASQKGISGDDVIWARGLPGIHAPESSGKLIAETFSRIWKEMEN